MTGRVWDEEREPEPVPVVLVSSRDGAPIPAIRGLARLIERAEQFGWVVGVTYARAELADHFFLNGRLAKAAHQLASVVVRLARGAERGWAAWHSEDGAPWAFVCAWFGIERRWATAGKNRRPTLAGRLAQ